MVQIFYSIFNDSDELLFANNTQYNTKEEATTALNDLYSNVVKQHNIKVVEHTDTTLKFIDLPQTELEGKEIHIFQIL